MKALEDSQARPAADWAGSNGGQIVDASNLKLVKGDDGDPAAVVKTSNLDWAVKVGQDIRFTVDTANGGRCEAGSTPSLTITVGGVDQTFTCGAAGGQEVVGSIANGGRITTAVFKYTGVSGTIKISGFTINGEAVHFE